MTATARAILQAIGLGMLGGVIVGAVSTGNPFGAITYILAAIGLGLWTVMTYAVPAREVTS
jgi:hypothetical protein